MDQGVVDWRRVEEALVRRGGGGVLLVEEETEIVAGFVGGVRRAEAPFPIWHGPLPKTMMTIPPEFAKRGIPNPMNPSPPPLSDAIGIDPHPPLLLLSS